jgi:hypothetical protein
MVESSPSRRKASETDESTKLVLHASSSGKCFSEI